MGPEQPVPLELRARTPFDGEGLMAFFAARALEMGSARAGEMTVDVLQLPGLTPASLKDYDVIVLANVGELPAPLVAG